MNNKPSECPTVLKSVLDEANLLPNYDWSRNEDFTAGLFDSDEGEKRFKKHLQLLTPDFLDHHKEWISYVLKYDHAAMLKKANRLWGDESKRYIQPFGVNIGWNLIEVSEYRISSFYPLHRLVRAITHSQNVRKDLLTVIADFNNSRVQSQGFDLKKIKREVGVEFDHENGVVKYADEYKTVWDLVIENQIDIRRLLECPVCKKIVWKSQITAETCGQRKCVQRQKYLKKKAETERRELERKASREEWKNKFN